MRLAIVIVAILLGTLSCREVKQVNSGADQSSQPAVSSEPATTPNSAARFAPDLSYLQFSQLIKVESSAEFDRTNPHQVASHSVNRCQNGATEQLLQELNHVEKDEKLGSAFATYLRVFGPDLEKFKGVQLFLKFEAYQDGGDTSVWYYYLVDSKAEHLEHKPWISIHRSKHDGGCALAGIFLNAAGEEVVAMPPGLRRS